MYIYFRTLLEGGGGGPKILYWDRPNSIVVLFFFINFELLSSSSTKLLCVSNNFDFSICVKVILFSDLKMVNDDDSFFLQVPISENSTNDSFGILNEDEMKDFTFGGESFLSVLEDNHQLVNESVSTSMILPVDTRALLESPLSKYVKVDDSYLKNNGNFTLESHEKVSVLSDERVIASKRACDTMGVLKSVDMQGPLSSTFGKDDSSCNHVERESRNKSLAEKVGFDGLRSKSGYLNETFDAEVSLEDVDSTDIASKLKFSSKSQTNFSAVQMSLRNNNELASSSSCHSTFMKDIEEFGSFSDSTYVEKSNKAILDHCDVVSPSSASGDKLPRSNKIKIKIK